MWLASRMACMDDRRKDESSIVVGCLVVGLLFAIVATGAGGMWLYRSARVQVAEQRAATIARDLEAQMSAIDAEASPLKQEDKPDESY